MATKTDEKTETERLLSILEQQALNQALQIERTAPKENPNYKALSPFLKESGESWAKDLKCEMYFGSISYNESPLTKEEVAALNRVRPLAKGVITRNDGTALRVSVVAKEDAEGRFERLTIQPEGRQPNLNLTMPSIIAMATELAAQADARAAA